MTNSTLIVTAETYDDASDVADAAIQTRDLWRTYALYLMEHPPTPDAGAADPVAADLYEGARRADEDLADMLAHPEHYKAEKMRLERARAVDLANAD